MPQRGSRRRCNGRRGNMISHASVAAGEKEGASRLDAPSSSSTQTNLEGRFTSELRARRASRSAGPLRVKRTLAPEHGAPVKRRQVASVRVNTSAERRPSEGAWDCSNSAC